MATYMLFLLGWERSLEYFQLRSNGGGVKLNWCQVGADLITFLWIQKIENLICEGLKLRF
jgi:hypothetical protein